MRVFKPFIVLTLFLVLSTNRIASSQSQSSESELPIVLKFEQLTQLRDDLRDIVETEQLANLSFEVWQNNRLVRAGFFGPVSEQNSDTVSDDTIQRIYSLTKPVTAVGLLILMERSEFRLDDPITKFLPEFEKTEVLADSDPNGDFYTYRPPRPPTMAQLLSHTAGLAYGGEALGPVNQRLRDHGVQSAADLQTLTNIVSGVPYISAPGAEWNYSVASDLQGAIIERISGESLDNFLKREVFDPLGMVDTSFYVESEDLSRVSGITERSDNGFVYLDAEDPTKDAQSEMYYEGGHGLFSTQRDYARFLALLGNKGELDGVRLLEPDTVSQLATNAVQYRGAPSAMRGRGVRAGLGFGFGVAVLENRHVTEMSAPRGTYYWYSAKGKIGRASCRERV